MIVEVSLASFQIVDPCLHSLVIGHGIEAKPQD